MRQRFLISKKGSANDLAIQEFAVIGQEPRQAQGALAAEDNYTFLYQESYAGEVINGAIDRGINDLVATLRTDHLFPNRILTETIAASVIELFRFSEDHSIELFFDDKE